ncbi:MAG: hypothetical protein ACLFNR_02055 [Candidatus Paceibacterota bacterium]
MKHSFFQVFLIVVLIAPLFTEAQTQVPQEDDSVQEAEEFLQENEELLEDTDVSETDPLEDFDFREYYKELENYDHLQEQLLEIYGITEEDMLGPFDIKSRPDEIPQADQDVEFWIKTNHDLDNAMVYWSINGEVKKEGYGEDTFEFKTGEIGEEYTVEVEAHLQDGTVRNDSFSFSPADVDMIWETDTHTPAPYKGKSLSSSLNNGKMSVIALPNFEGSGYLEDPNDYIFSWKINGSDHRSGRGKNAISFDISDLSYKRDIGLEVRSLNGDMVLRKKVPFPKEAEPEVLLYKKDSYGVNYNLAINDLEDHTLEQEVINLKAEPFFYSNPEKNSLEIDWQMNNETIPDLTNSLDAEFGVDNDFQGRSKISVSVDNKDNFREKSKVDLILQVNNEARRSSGGI